MAQFKASFSDQWTISHTVADTRQDGFHAPGAWALDVPASSGGEISVSTSDSIEINNLLEDRVAYTKEDLARLDLQSPGVSDYIYFSDFGFNIPSGATIDGVEVLLYFGGTETDIELETCRLALSANAASLSPGNRLPADPSNIRYVKHILGGPSDTFGTALTPATVNSSDFGLVLRFDRPANFFDDLVYIWDLGIRVTYTVSSTDGDVEASHSYAEILSRSAKANDVSHLVSEVLTRTTEDVDASSIFAEILRSIPGAAGSGAKRRLIILQGD